MDKKLPERTCVACNKKGEKKNYIRIVKDKENKIFVDVTGKSNGRGAYICKDVKCLEKLIKTNKLERVFNTKIDSEIYENLREVIVESSEL